MDVGELAVVLDARTKEFQGALKKAEARIGRFEKTAKTSTAKTSAAFKGLGKKMVAFAAGFATMAAAVKLKRATEANLDFLDSIDKASGKLGVTTKFFQQAEYAASQSGVSFGEVSTALAYVAKNAGDAARGIGDAKDVFTELEIELVDTNDQLKGTDELFREALRAIGGMSSEADRVRAAMRIFGRSGVAIINMADSFDTLSEKAESAGLVVDEKLIARAVWAKDELDTLSRTVRANLAEALVDLTPALIGFSNKLVDIANSAAWAWTKISDVLNLQPRGIEAMRDRAAELREEIDELQRDIERWNKLTFGVGFLRAKGGERELLEKQLDLELLEAQIDAARKRLARPRVSPTKPMGPPIPTTKEESLTELKGMAEMSGILEQKTASSLSMLQAMGIPATALAEALAWAGEEAGKVGGPLEGLGEAIGEDVRQNVRSGLVEGLKGGEVEASEVMSNISDSMSTRFLEAGVDEMMGGLEDGFSDVFETLGPKLGEALGMADMGPLSGAVQSAVAMAAGIGLSMITSAIGGTKGRQTYADIQRATATTDVREMRGIAVGETTVGIAEIAPRLEDALTPLTAIAREHLTVARGILAALSGGYSRGAGAALDVEVAGLLENSPSLTY